MQPSPGWDVGHKPEEMQSETRKSNDMELQIGDKVTFMRRCIYSHGNYIPSERITTRSITEIHSKYVRENGQTFWVVTLKDKQKRVIFLHTNEEGRLVGHAEKYNSKRRFDAWWWVVQVNDTPLYMS